MYRIAKLMAMQASDELSEEEARQLTFDLEYAYSEFHAALEERD